MTDPQTTQSSRAHPHFERFETKGARLLKLLQHSFPVAIDLNPDQLADSQEEAPPAELFRVTEWVWRLLEHAPRAQSATIALEQVLKRDEGPKEPERDEISAALHPVIARFREGKTDIPVFAAEVEQAGLVLGRLSPFRCVTQNEANERVDNWLYHPFVATEALDDSAYLTYLGALREAWRLDESQAAERMRVADTARAVAEAEQLRYRALDRAISIGVIRYFEQGNLMSTSGPREDDDVWFTCVLTPKAVMTSFQQVPQHLMPPDLSVAAGSGSNRNTPAEARSIAQMLAADVPLGMAKGFVSGSAEGLGGSLVNTCGALGMSAFRGLCALIAP